MGTAKRLWAAGIVLPEDLEVGRSYMTEPVIHPRVAVMGVRAWKLGEMFAADGWEIIPAERADDPPERRCVGKGALTREAAMSFLVQLAALLGKRVVDHAAS
jgi:hypothetical protein